MTYLVGVNLQVLINYFVVQSSSLQLFLVVFIYFHPSLHFVPALVCI